MLALRGIQSLFRTQIYRAASTTAATSATATPVASSQPATESSEGELDKLYSRLELELRSADRAVIKSYVWFLGAAARHLGIECGRSWSLDKPQKDRLTLLKAVHVYKKHRVQYELRTYFHFIHFHKLTGSTMDTFLEYVERNLPEGVAMKVTKTEVRELPEHLNEDPSHVTPEK